MSVTAWFSRDSSRDLRFLLARWLLGCNRGRMGLHPAELHYRVGARRALRSLQRITDSDGDFLRGEPSGNRADYALVLPARETRDGRLAAVGYSRDLFCDNRCSPG